MNPFFLTFHDKELEGRYLRQQSRMSQDSWRWAWSLVRLVGLKAFLCTRRIHVTGYPEFTYAAYLLLVLTPVFQNLLQNWVSESWFHKHGARQVLILGLIQVFINVVIIDHSLAGFSRDSNMNLAEIMVASGVCAQCFNIFWNRPNFFLFLWSSVFSSLMYHVKVISPYCRLVDRSNFADNWFSMLMGALDNALVVSKTSYKTHSCSRFLSFSSIYFGVICMSYVAWTMEKCSRESFLSGLSRQPYWHRSTTFKESGKILLLMLPVSWQLVDLFHLIFK